LPDGRGNIGGIFKNAIQEKVMQSKPQMVVCIVPFVAKDVYDAIKLFCCVEYGIPSQVITSNILNMNQLNKTRSVITKVAIQMNCKLGGEPWALVIPVFLFVTQITYINLDLKSNLK
jgi:aubergine